MESAFHRHHLETLRRRQTLQRLLDGNRLNTRGAHQLLMGGGGGSGDPQFANVKCLMHGNGSNGGTTFTDQKGHAFSTLTGSPVTSTSAPKFGSASLSFPGTSDALQTTSFEADFDFLPTYTFEFWLKVPSLTGTGSLCCWFQNGAGAERYLYITGSKITSNNSWASSNPVSHSTALTANTWQHIAICGDGSRTRSFLDGGLEANVATVSTTNSTARKIQFGNNGSTAGNNLVMFIDDFRLTRNVARYTAAFTPDATEFPDS